MAEKYETRPFEYVNNKDCRFYEASVNGKFWEAIKVNKTPILNELRNYSMTFKRK